MDPHQKYMHHLCFNPCEHKGHICHLCMPETKAVSYFSSSKSDLLYQEEKQAKESFIKYLDTDITKTVLGICSMSEEQLRHSEGVQTSEAWKHKAWCYSQTLLRHQRSSSFSHKCTLQCYVSDHQHQKVSHMAQSRCPGQPSTPFTWTF